LRSGPRGAVASGQWGDAHGVGISDFREDVLRIERRLFHSGRALRRFGAEGCLKLPTAECKTLRLGRSRNGRRAAKRVELAAARGAGAEAGAQDRVVRARNPRLPQIATRGIVDALSESIGSEFDDSSAHAGISPEVVSEVPNPVLHPPHFLDVPTRHVSLRSSSGSDRSMRYLSRS
jgi:hypothetical protein